MVARLGCGDSDPDLSLSLSSDRLNRDALKIGSPWLIESHRARFRHRAVALAGGSPCGFRDRTGAPGGFLTLEPNFPAQTVAGSAAWVFLAFAETGKIPGKAPENLRETPKNGPRAASIARGSLPAAWDAFARAR
jgi:hypothetical protein